MKLFKTAEGRRRVAIALLCLLIFATVAFIFSNSMKSKLESGSDSHRLSELLQSILDPNEKIDRDVFHTAVRKLAHFAEFFALGAELALLRYLLCGRLLGIGASSVALTILVIADTDELIQSFTGRGSLVRDVFIDFSGGLTGALCAILLLHIFLRVRARRDRKGGAA